MSILVDEPPPDCSFIRGHKLPFVASEMLSSSAPEVLDKVIGEPTVLDQLFRYIDAPVTNLTSAAYFCGAVCALLSRNPALMYQCVFSENKLPMAVLRNLKSRSLADLVFKLLFMDSSVSSHYLLERFSILKELVRCLSADRSPEEQSNAAAVLCDLIRQMEAKSWKLLVCSLIQREQLETLLQNIVSGGESGAGASMSVLNALLSCESLSELSDINLEKVIRVIQWSEDTNRGEEESETEPEDALIPLLIEYLPKVISRLKGDAGQVGLTRIQICELIDIMLKQKSPLFDKMIIDAGGLLEVTKLFYQFPLNSLLHKAYEALVHTVFDKSSEAVQRHVMLDVDLPGSVVQAVLGCKGCPGNSGLGSMGYVTRISNFLTSKAPDFPWWTPSPEWTDYSNRYLKSVNEIEKQPATKKDTSDDEEEPEFNVEDVIGSPVIDQDQDDPQAEDENNEEIKLEALVMRGLKTYSPEELSTLCRATAAGDLQPAETVYEAADYWRVPISPSEELEELD